MKVINPLTLTLDSSNVSEPSAGESAYNASTVYVVGGQAIDATNHLTYESLIGTAETATISNGSPAVITWATHGLIENTPILFTTDGALPTGLTAGQIYYVLDPQLNSFNVSETVGGAAVGTSSAGSGTHTATANPNVGYALTDTTAWALVGATNKYKMFELDRNTVTTNSDTIRVQVTPPQASSGIGLVGLEADTLYIQVQGNLSVSRANYFGKSAQFDDGAWSKNAGSFTANAAYGPFWEKTADLFVPNTSNTVHYFLQTQSSSSGDWCMSIFAKPGGYSKFRLRMSDGSANIDADFDLDAGTVGTVSSGGSWTNADTGIVAAKNGYYRCWIAGTQGAGTTLTCYAYALNSAGNPTFAGDGTSGIYFDGAMLDDDLELRSYLANTGTGDLAGGTGAQNLYEYEESLIIRDVVDYWDYLTVPFSYKETVYLENLPPYNFTDIIVALIKDGGTVSCGGLVVGSPVFIGDTQYNAVSDALNFSTIERDTFGNVTLSARRSVPTSEVTTFCPKERVDQAIDIRDEVNATPALWVGLDDDDNDYFNAVLRLGVYKRFAIDLAHPSHAKISLSLEEI